MFWLCFASLTDPGKLCWWPGYCVGHDFADNTVLCKGIRIDYLLLFQSTRISRKEH